MNILVIGIDRVSDYLYGLADVIRIVRVDFVTPRVNVFSLPRDLWVEILGIEDEFGITQGKLNQAYFYGTPGRGITRALEGEPACWHAPWLGTSAWWSIIMEL